MLPFAYLNSWKKRTFQICSNQMSPSKVASFFVIKFDYLLSILIKIDYFYNS